MNEIIRLCLKPQMFGEFFVLCFLVKCLWQGKERNWRVCSPEEKEKRGGTTWGKIIQEGQTGASLVHFRIFIEAKPLGQPWGFRNNVSDESIRDSQGKLEDHTHATPGPRSHCQLLKVYPWTIINLSSSWCVYVPAIPPSLQLMCVEWKQTNFIITQSKI